MMSLILIVLTAFFGRTLSLQWRELAVSENPNKLAAISYREGIFTSEDAGVTWKSSKAPLVPWNSIAMARNGDVLSATAGKHGLFVSSQGDDWKKISLTGPSDWKSVKISSSGQYLMACTSDSVHRSEDFGLTWTESSVESDGHWNTISMDSTGKYGIVAGLAEGIFVSSDFGQTWKASSAVNNGWASVTMDGSGKFAVAVSVGEGIFHSSDFGVTWQKTSAPEGLHVQSISCDETGRFVVATASEAGIYYSSDYGMNWVKTIQPSTSSSSSSALSARKTKASWVSAVMSRSGDAIYAIEANHDKIFQSVNRGQSWEFPEHRAVKEYDNLFTVDAEAGKELLSHSGEVFALVTASTDAPSDAPTYSPSEFPTVSPSQIPTYSPSEFPTVAPTPIPSVAPTFIPTTLPTFHPSSRPSNQPSSHPSSQPSSQPSTQPTGQPTAPTFAPSVLPTHAPVAPGSTDTVEIKGKTLINTVQGALNSGSLDCIENTLKSTCGAQDVEITKFYEEGSDVVRRRLGSSRGEVMIEIQAVDTNWYIEFLAIYFMSNYPGMNTTSVSTKYTNQIITAFSSGDFQALLRANAQQLNATQLFNAIVSQVNLTSTVTPASSGSTDSGSDGSPLSDGQIAGIVIGVVFGTMILLIVAYFYVREDRKNVRLSVPPEQQYSSYNAASNNSPTPQVHAEESAMVDDTFTLNMDHNDLESSVVVINSSNYNSTDLTNHNVEIRL